jgi:hypothetical protein
MKSQSIEKLEKLVKGSLIASNFIEKNISEGVKFKDIPYLSLIVDWMEEYSGFDGDLVLQCMEKHYNLIVENSKEDRSLIMDILVTEVRSRLGKDLGIRVN